MMKMSLYFHSALYLHVTTVITSEYPITTYLLYYYQFDEQRKIAGKHHNSKSATSLIRNRKGRHRVRDAILLTGILVGIARLGRELVVSPLDEVWPLTVKLVERVVLRRMQRNGFRVLNLLASRILQLATAAALEVSRRLVSLFFFFHLIGVIEIFVFVEVDQLVTQKGLTLQLDFHFFRNIRNDSRSNELSTHDNPLEANEDPQLARIREIVRVVKDSHCEADQRAVGDHSDHRDDREDGLPSANVLSTFGNGALEELTILVRKRHQRSTTSRLTLPKTRASMRSLK